jgi:hypothetical protein
METERMTTNETIIPQWVPLSLRRVYHDIAQASGEEEAASQVRQLKRQMTPEDLRLDAEADRQSRLGFKVRRASA